MEKSEKVSAYYAKEHRFKECHRPFAEIGAQKQVRKRDL